MKNKLFESVLIAAAVFGIYAAASSVSAQTDVIVGGYGENAVSDKDVVKAAGFAVKKEAGKTGKHITLVRIEKAETQVVAGINYRVCMTVRIGRKGAAEKSVTAVVYKNLKNRMSLSRWEEGGCQEL